jgi:hypothetical protein
MSFYHRFEDILSRYPISDLRRDLIYVDLVKPHDSQLLTLTDVVRPPGSTLKQRRVEALQKEVERCERIANARYRELQDQAQQIEQLSRDAARPPAAETLQEIAAELDQKIDRLQLIEERINKDLRGVRKVGRAVSWTGSALKALVQPPVSAVRAAMLAADAPAAAPKNHRDEPGTD